MNIFGFNITKREKRNLEQPSISYEERISQGMTTFQELLNPNDRAQNLSSVYRCVDLISSTVANLPLNVLYIDKKGNTREQKNHRFQKVLDNMVMTRYNFMKKLITDVLLKGNAYCYLKRNEQGDVVDIIYLEPNDVMVIWDKKKQELYYQIPFLSKVQKIQAFDIIHLQNNSNNGIHGQSVLSFAARQLQIAHGAENSAKQIFQSGGQPARGVLSTLSPISKAQKQQLAANWTQSTNGVLVLGGDMKFTPLSANAEEMQLLDSRKFNAIEICSFFGVPPELLGLGNKSSNVEDLMNLFLTTTIQNYISMIEHEFSRKMFSPQSQGRYKIDVDENSMLRMSKSSQAAFFSSMIERGILSINEARLELGYESIGQEGDKHIIAYTDIEQNTINNSDTQEEENEGTEGKGN
jgi:phage portal protein, HK97 family|nr:MAG TPA: portal protein [Caudoviricetes sp.]